MARRTRTLKLFKTRLAPAFPMTAFAAVTLTLVVLFMLLTPLTDRYARVSLPTIARAGSTVPFSSRTLSVELNGTYTLDGRQVEAARLAAVLGEVGRQSPQPTLRVRGDRGLTYRQVKEVLDLARSAGVQDLRLEVAFVKEGPAASRPAAP